MKQHWFMDCYTDECDWSDNLEWDTDDGPAPLPMVCPECLDPISKHNHLAPPSVVILSKKDIAKKKKEAMLANERRKQGNKMRRFVRKIGRDKQ